MDFSRQFQVHVGLPQAGLVLPIALTARTPSFLGLIHQPNDQSSQSAELNCPGGATWRPQQERKLWGAEGVAVAAEGRRGGKASQQSARNHPLEASLTSAEHLVYTRHWSATQQLRSAPFRHMTPPRSESLISWRCLSASVMFPFGVFQAPFCFAWDLPRLDQTGILRAGARDKNK